MLTYCHKKCFLLEIYISLEECFRQGVLYLKNGMLVRLFSAQQRSLLLQADESNEGLPVKIMLVSRYICTFSISIITSDLAHLPQEDVGDGNHRLHRSCTQAEGYSSPSISDDRIDNSQVQKDKDDRVEKHQHPSCLAGGKYT